MMELMNDWTIVWRKQTNEWMKKVKRKNGCNKEQTSWLSLGNEWMNKWMDKWFNEWMNKWLMEWMNDWTIDWTKKQMNEWKKRRKKRLY